MIWVVVQTVLLTALVGAFLTSTATPPVYGPIGGIVGTLGVCFGVGLAGRAFRDLGRAISISPEPKIGATLVRTGVYGFLRHPMYTSVVLIAVGMLWVRPSPRVLGTAALVVAFYLLKARYEEARLRARYPEYEVHARETYGVIPVPRSRN
jgi:protein-S-isoprenylcysteine O-methyltransferase Ste14